MANGKHIDLEFTVADVSSSNILSGLTKITADANKDPSITGIRFKLADDGKELRSSLQSALGGISKDLAKAIDGGLGKSSSSVFKGLQDDIKAAAKTVEGFKKTTMSVNVADLSKAINSSLGGKLSGANVDKIVADLKTLDVQIKNVAASMQSTKKGEIIKVSVSGVDELGRAVTLVQQYSKETDSVSTVGAKMVTSLDTSADGVKRFTQEVNSAFTYMKSLQSKIGQQQVKIAKIDPNNTSELLRELELLKQLQTEYNSLNGVYAQHFSKKQANQLQFDTTKADNQLKTVEERIQRTRESAAQKIQLDLDLGTTESKIKTLEKQFQDLGTVPDAVKGKFADLHSLMQKVKDESDPQIRTSAWQELNNILDALQKNYSAAAAASREFGQTIDDSTAKAAAGDLMDRMTASLNDYSAGALLARGKVKELITQLQGLQSAGDTKALVEGVKNIGAAFDDVQSRAASFQTAFQKFTSKMSTGIKQALGISTVGMAVRKAVQEAKKMYNEVLKIDTAMTGLYKVTDETSERYDRFLKSTSKNAQKLGSTISGLIDQSATWAKLGYSMDEAEGLAQISSIYAHVGEVDNDTAVSDLITSMKAFNITAEESVTIVDRLNELGNNYAVSSADLGAALARSASSLHLAGTSIDKALAMVTGGAEITQKPAEFGNFLKIAVMRIRGMKGELEELGEDVDQTVDSISKVQTQILNRTHGKVNIFGDDGEFRDYYEIMKEISEVWDELNSKDRASLSEILFGKVRSNQGAALIQAFQSGQVEKALNTSLNSQGSAMKEYERWMQSLEAKTNQFKAAYQNLSQTVLNSDFLKGAVDTGTNFLNVLTKIIDKIGILPTLLGAGGALFGITHIGKHHCPAWA